jgi:ribA/ribD-fused uncharacterized protein
MLFPEQDENSHYFRRDDVESVLGTFSAHTFKLDDLEWPSVEHYFQANKFIEKDANYAERVRTAKTAKQARKLGRKNKAGLRKDWSTVKRIVMTRAVYTKCKTHNDIAQNLLETGDARLVENSQYDYVWGCGRDRRGENLYGKVLMDVRAKLQEELS